MDNPVDNHDHDHDHGLVKRPRRLRHSEGIRRMVRQIRLDPADFICPLFVTHGHQVRREIPSMPGQFQCSIDVLAREAQDIVDHGIPAVILFGIPENKDDRGTAAFDSDGIIQQAIRSLKSDFPELVVITDVCLCEYTSHGHCGLLNDEADQKRNGLPGDYVLNDETLATLSSIAVSHAQCGADIVAPSGMMDGMVAAIRESLDTSGFEHVAIMSYSVKYDSAFYGPFRDAAEGAPKFGDRKTHQMDPAESRQPMIEASLDIEQGSDFLMVKPALAYLDVICRIRQQFPDVPLVAYNVSGEYAMIKAAAEKGWLDERRVVLETLTGIKRAGADLIITYHAKDACQWLKEK